MANSIILPAAIGVAVVLVGVAFASGDNGPSSKRMGAVAKKREGNLRRKADPEADRRKKITGGLKEIEAREKQARKTRLSLSTRIQQAGLSLTPSSFIIMSVGFGFFAAILALLFHAKLALVAAAAFVAGFGLPQWVLKFLCGRRQKKFTSEFASAIEVIVRGVKSGLPLNECLKIIGREAPEPLGSEFRRLVDQASMGVPFEQALGRMYERMPLSEVSFFSIVLSIQQKAGGNLSEALQNLATVLRARKLMREKIKALSSEAKASASIIGSLPIVVGVLVSITSPAYIGLLFSDATGNFALMVGAGMMGTGIMVMRQMINFEI